MTITYPESWATLAAPYRRAELRVVLEELATPDPRPVWREERRRGLVSDIDQVFHFFFDDNEFDDSAIGYTLLNENEVGAIAAVMRALGRILADLPNGDDEEFVRHRLWIEVTKAAVSALVEMSD